MVLMLYFLFGSHNVVVCLLDACTTKQTSDCPRVVANAKVPGVVWISV